MGGFASGGLIASQIVGLGRGVTLGDLLGEGFWAAFEVSCFHRTRLYKIPSIMSICIDCFIDHRSGCCRYDPWK